MKRVLWADTLKIISIFAVIIIHSSAPLLTLYKKDNTAWNIGNIYESLSRWCIPVFFMLSGEFILQQVQKESFWNFYFKRFKKIVIPFLIWSAVYFLWKTRFKNEQISISESFLIFLKEPVYYHLWFIYTLLGLYLLSPLMGTYLKSAGKESITVFLFLWFVFGSVIPTFESLFKLEVYLSIGTTSHIFNFSGYFMLGYILKDFRINGREKILMCALFIATFIFTAYMTSLLTYNSENGALVDTFYDYYSVNVLLMSVAVFLIAKDSVILKKSRTLQKIIRVVASSVPGIYLIHAIVISLFKGGLLPFTFSETFINPAIGVPVFAGVIFMSSLILVLVLKQVPVINCFIP